MPIVSYFLTSFVLSVSYSVLVRRNLSSAFTMIQTLQNAVLFLVLVSCTHSASVAEHNDLNKVLSSVILEMNNEGVFTEYWYVMYSTV
jgi:amino acid permease